MPFAKLFFLSEWKVCVLVRMFIADLWAELAASLSSVLPIFVFLVTWGAFTNILFLFLDSLIFDAPKISESYFCVLCFCYTTASGFWTGFIFIVPFYPESLRCSLRYWLA